MNNHKDESRYFGNNGHEENTDNKKNCQCQCDKCRCDDESCNDCHCDCDCNDCTCKGSHNPCCE